MKEIATALCGYFNSFGIPGYVENSVPTDEELPYITYNLQQHEWNTGGTMQVRVWYSGTSFAPLFTMTDLITNDIGNGKTISAGEGFIMLNKGSPLVQLQPSDEINLKIAYINLEIQTIL